MFRNASVICHDKMFNYGKNPFEELTEMFGKLTENVKVNLYQNIFSWFFY